MIRAAKNAGFTLLEVLIAVAITALIGVGATQLLANIIDSRRTVEIRSEQLASLQRLDMTLSRDIEQYINRGIRDEFGEHQAALLLNSGLYNLEFTRAGWRNSPLAEQPRSELQRVAYKLENIHSDACEIARERLQSWGEQELKGDCLVRYFWPVLDRANRIEPVAQMLLEQVDGLEIEVLAGERLNASENGTNSQGSAAQSWHATWPEIGYSEQGTQQLLAVRWRLRLPALGELERLWLVVGGRND